MNKYQILAARFQWFSKYLRIIAVISLIVYLILAAINVGDMVVITYIFLLTAIISGFQSVVLWLLSKLYQNKK